MKSSQNAQAIKVGGSVPQQGLKINVKGSALGGSQKNPAGGGKGHVPARPPLILERYKQLDFTGIFGYPNPVPIEVRTA